MAVILFALALLVPSLLATDTKIDEVSKTEISEDQINTSNTDVRADLDVKISEDDGANKELVDYQNALDEISDVKTILTLTMEAGKKSDCLDAETLKDLEDIRGKVASAVEKCDPGNQKIEKPAIDESGIAYTKIREIDEKIKINKELCTSLREETPDACKEEEKRLEEEKEKLIYENFPDEVKNFIEKYNRIKNCFDEESKEYRWKFILLKQQLDNCKDNDRLSSYM